MQFFEPISVGCVQVPLFELACVLGSTSSYHGDHRRSLMIRSPNMERKSLDNVTCVSSYEDSFLYQSTLLSCQSYIWNEALLMPPTSNFFGNAFSGGTAHTIVWLRMLTRTRLREG